MSEVPEALPGAPRLPDEAREKRSPLRVAILIDSPSVPAWVHRAVANVQESGFSRIVLVVQSRAGPPRPLPIRHLLYRFYRAADKRLAGLTLDALAPSDLSPLLRDVPVMEVEPIRGRHSDFLRAEDVDRIRELDLDVALRFGFQVPRGEFLTIARLGVWSIHHGSDLRQHGLPPGLWEVLDREPMTSTALCRLADDTSSSTVLYQSHGSTDHISSRRNASNSLWKAAHFPVRAMREYLLAGSGDTTFGQEPPRYLPRLAQRDGLPGNVSMARYLVRLVFRYAWGKLKMLGGPYQWYLAYRLVSRPTDAGDDFRDLVRLMPPRNRLWADPFVMERDGRHYVFVEEMELKGAKGRIAVIPFDDAGKPGPSSPVLELACHLSYPFVFEWRGESYMIPEMSQSRRVTLFRCVSWPDRWVEEKVLLEGLDAVDATLEEIDGKWWMFVNIAEPGTRNWDELHLFHAPTPLGPWTPHKRNPVKSDCRSARPAGRLFRWRGQLLRPAQMCAGEYGNAVVVLRIVRLDEEHFVEEQESVIQPSWDDEAGRVHTLNRAPGMIVVDLLRRRPLFSLRGRSRPGH